MSFTGLSYPILIGSFPGRDHEEALSLILKYTPEIPCWPQLPDLPEEGMLVQFSRGLPGFDARNLIIDPERPDFEEEQLKFYEEYLKIKEGKKTLSESFFAIKKEEAPGLFLLDQKIATLPSRPYALKGQITGPFTLATGLKTPDGRAPFYDESLRDLITKLVALKAAFQVHFFKKHGLPVIIFLDEPALAGFGSSSFVGVSREEVIAVLQEVATEIEAAGGIPGAHVCANTEWDLLIESGLKILNFDAFDYLDRFLLYEKDISSFLSSGGNVAWGIVPTLKMEALKETTAEELIGRLNQAFERLSKFNLSRKKILRQSLLTPSCGMGTLKEELVLKALSLLRQITESFRKDF